MSADRRRTADDLLKARAQHWPEAVTPISRLMVRVFRFGNLVLENARREVASHGLTLTEFEVLVTLRSVQPPHQLAITRGEGETDRRSKPVRLTAKGRALAERAMADVLRTDGELVAGGLSENEIERLTRMLGKLLATLEPRQAARSEDR